MEPNTILLAFGLTLLAGLSTGIGSALAFFAKHTNTKFLSIALGFSAGVMIYVSFVEIFPESKAYLVLGFGSTIGSVIAVASFFGGMAFVAVVDKLIPYFENPHEIHKVEELHQPGQVMKYQSLFKMGILTAVVIAIHNFPEGIATFTSALQDLKTGVVIALAIAIHNIPEGIAVSIPIFYSTGSRKKAFIYSFLSGLSEPVGAVLGYLLLYPFLSNSVFGVLFGAVAGIMVFISLDQLLPTARKYGEHHLSMYGLIAGMVVMALSLLLFMQ